MTGVHPLVKGRKDNEMIENTPAAKVQDQADQQPNAFDLPNQQTEISDLPTAIEKYPNLADFLESAGFTAEKANSDATSVVIRIAQLMETGQITNFVATRDGMRLQLHDGDSEISLRVGFEKDQKGIVKQGAVETVDDRGSRRMSLDGTSMEFIRISITPDRAGRGAEGGEEFTPGLGFLFPRVDGQPGFEPSADGSSPASALNLPFPQVKQES